MTPSEPQDSMTPSEPDEKALLEMLKPAIDDLLKEHIDNAAQFEKNIQYMRLRKASYYVKGIQHIAPEVNVASGTVDWTPAGVPLASTTDRDDILDYDIDLIKTYLRKFVAVLGQRPFGNAKCLPKNPQSEADRRAARQGQLAQMMLGSQWNTTVKNMELAYHYYVNGTVFGHPQYVADRVKYGTHKEPNVVQNEVQLSEGGYKCHNCNAISPQLSIIGDESVCPSCLRPLGEGSYQPPETTTVPEQDGTFTEYAKGQVELHFRTGITTTVPNWIPTLSDTPYLKDEYEEHKARLLYLYPDLRDKMNSVGDLSEGNDYTDSTEQTGRMSRSSAASATGAMRTSNDRWTYKRYWFRPWIYELVKDEANRNLLKKHFADGLKVCRVQSNTVALAHETIEQRFIASKPEISETLVTDGLCWGILGHQDAYNDMFNLAICILERSVPVHLADPDVLDVQAWNERPANPQEMIEIKPGYGNQLESAIKTLPTAKFPDQLQSLVAALEANIQTHLGLFPNVYGGGSGKGNQTAEQARNDLNQALMQLGAHGQMMSNFWTDLYPVAIKELIDNTPIPISVNNEDGGSEMLDIEALKGGEFYFEGEPGVPRSWAERKDALQQLVQQNPQMTHALGIDDPTNIDKVADYYDLPDLDRPGQEARDKIQEVLEQLLQGTPVQGPPSMGMDGMPMPPQQLPSIPFEDFVIDPALAVTVAKDYLNSKPIRKKFGTPGYANVVAWGLQAQDKAAAMAPPPDMAPTGKSGGDTGPKGPKPTPTGEPVEPKPVAPPAEQAAA